MFQIDLKSKNSIYEQIVDNIKKLIVSGAFPADTKLPSVRDLAGMLMVNPNTIQKSYRELENQGYIYTAAGLGCFVSKRSDIKQNATSLKSLKIKMTSCLKELQFLGYTKEEAEKILSEWLSEQENWE